MVQLEQQQTDPQDDQYREQVPPEFICPITHQIIQEPLFSRLGISYEREAIVEWICRRQGAGKPGTCPLTRKPLRLSDLAPNRDLQGRIHAWLVVNKIGAISLAEGNPEDTDSGSDDESCDSEHSASSSNNSVGDLLKENCKDGDDDDNNAAGHWSGVQPQDSPKNSLQCCFFMEKKKKRRGWIRRQHKTGRNASH